jgi:flavin reductase (DIM6/NTAB) family NADH-FMN oxidoreductase RutF
VELDVRANEVVRVYRALTDLVVPRPIAWVTSIDLEDRVNLAPFSFFNAFGANPPVVVFSPTCRRDGSKKDTLLNVEKTGEFVINLAVAPLAEAVNETSRELPHGESEAVRAGLELVPSAIVRPPRVAASRAHLECRVLQIVPIGSGAIAANLVIGEVVWIHAREELLTEAGAIDPRKLQAIARLGGDYYCRTGDLFTMHRPQ